MSLLFIHARDHRFASCDEGAEYDRPETALALGIRGAVALVTDEIYAGERSAAVEVSIEREDGTQLLRSIVAISVSALLPAVQSTSLSSEFFPKRS